MKTVVLLGRICFSLIFVMASFNNFNSATIQMARDHGVLGASFLVPFAGILALLGGLSVLFGYRAKVGAVLLILFLVPVTIVMHNFWASPTVAEGQIQAINFFKNLSMLGGAILISYFGAGPYSIDARATTLSEKTLAKPKAAA